MTLAKRWTGPAKPVSLALQGGGAHGAFQWGVLDRLLEYGAFDIQSITGASAGAMNAVALVSGLLEGGSDGARRKLERFWRAVSNGPTRGVFGENIIANFANDWLSLNPAFKYMQDMASSVTPMQVSPYDFNPLNYNPLRDILREEIDFKAIREQTGIAMFIAATAVRSNEAKVFQSHELTPEHIMASGCLPDVFQAVTIDGVDYWDGGYLANPPVWPLIECEARDVLLLLVNPMTTKKTPRTTGEIMDRLNEISFNASLAGELRTVAVVQSLIDKGQLTPSAGYRRLRFHAISADKKLGDLSLPSKFNTDWSFLENLKSRGREAADAWIKADFDKIGEQSTFNLAEAFL